MKENEMGRACGTHVAEEMCIQDFARKSWKKEVSDLMEDFDLYGMIILKLILKKYFGGPPCEL